MTRARRRSRGLALVVATFGVLGMAAPATAADPDWPPYDALYHSYAEMVAEIHDEMVRRTPLKRLGQPEDIALCALYLASPAGSFVTGKLFEVDGGLEEANLEMGLPDL